MILPSYSSPNKSLPNAFGKQLNKSFRNRVTELGSFIRKVVESLRVFPIAHQRNKFEMVNQ
jgi:hypothetical protein